MNRRFLLLLLVAVGAILGYTLYSSIQTPTADPLATYRASIFSDRKAKDEFFRKNKDSPLARRDTFTALPYFAPDLAYRVTAQLERLSEGLPYTVQMTGGETETYAPVGRASFRLDGQDCRLLVFRSAENGQLFVPFKDATNGTLSYGGGRYLDVPEAALQNNQLPLDFNRAYNPYCAYSPTFTCPIPPAENHLPVLVRAGEKVFH